MWGVCVKTRTAKISTTDFEKKNSLSWHDFLVKYCLTNELQYTIIKKAT